MSRVQTAKDIVERALRMIGNFPLSDSAPRGEAVREGMIWLDTLIEHVSGIGRLFFMTALDLPVALTPGTSVYPLLSSLGESYPEDGIQYPLAAWIENPEGQREPLLIASHQTWRDRSLTATDGLPRMIYIDRMPAPTLYIHPSIGADGPTGYSIILDVQTHATDVSPGGVTGTSPKAGALTKFRSAWDMYLIHELAALIGNGPVETLPQGRINDYRKVAEKAKYDLEVFENREHDTENPIAQPMGWSPQRGGGGGYSRSESDSSGTSGDDFNDDFNDDFGG
jgi:hypothetical protein